MGNPALSVLWGKSKAGPCGASRVNLLVQHLLDTAAVGELIWDHFLAATVRARIDLSCGGRGRAFFTLLCGLHDVGKASPAFQSKVPELAGRVRAAGLTWSHLDARARAWHHTLAGAVILRRVLGQAGWDAQALQWVWPLVAGHHGVVPATGKLNTGPARGDAQGVEAEWLAAQGALVAAVAAELQVDLASAVPPGCPRRAEQLALSGAIIMADWIASGDHFPGIGDLSDVSMAGARQRAERAWAQLGLRGGWSPAAYDPVPDLVAVRFARAARPIQEAAVVLAAQMPRPGLMMIEAPMGEGKTEAALAAAEVLARRFGADGVFVGMPTQATCDAMFTRVFEWAQRVEAGTPVGLLHGKRRFNREWHALQQKTRFVGIDEQGTAGVDEFGCGDEYGTVQHNYRRMPEAPAEWFLGPKRGLLTPVTVGTVDQLLHAATRTRHVMLRHAGLAGRVVIIDEVHAYDVYMAQFLHEALRWLADGGVPVILLSATLPPSLRRQLATAYLQGATLDRDVEPPPATPGEDGYPVVRSMFLRGDQARAEQRAAGPWRESLAVRVEVLDEGPDDGPEMLGSLLTDALADGGCALVVRNTVGRAQQTYRAIKAQFGDGEVVLLHARLTVGERADRAGRVLDLLGPPGRGRAPDRPHRLIVVATQLAEQSFDVDVDLLVTDLAPIDLLLQRAGRLYRHSRPADARPARLGGPRVVVAGVRTRPDAAPLFPRGSTHVYGRHLLLRSAALVADAAATGWSIPADVPALVRRGYGNELVVPAAWQSDAFRAQTEWDGSERSRRSKAAKYLLAGEDSLGTRDLAGLHDIPTRDLEDDDAVAAVVRDGPESVEVVLVLADDGRGHRTLDGRSIGVSGAAIHDPQIAEAVVQSAIRLPPRPPVTAAAKTELMPLPECGDDPWLRRTRVLILDENCGADLGGRRLIYDPDLGLLDEPAR
jgi:CRISPR-associated endonuclease/helicase Cas3